MKKCKWRAIGIIQMDKNTAEDYAKSRDDNEKWNKEHPNSMMRLGWLLPKYVNVLVWACNKHKHKYYQELEWTQITTEPPC